MQGFLDTLLRRAKALSDKVVQLKEARQQIDGIIASWAARELVSLRKERLDVVPSPDRTQPELHGSSSAATVSTSAMSSYLDDNVDAEGRKSAFSLLPWRSNGVDC